MKKAHPVRNIVIGICVLLLTAALVAGVWYGTRLEALTISQVEVKGGETIDLAVVTASVEQQLEGDYLRLIPRRFAWTYPETDIIDAIGEIERIHNITLSRQAKTLSVTFDEYAPHALWCDSRGSDKCVFLTSDGYGFAPAPALSGGSFVRYITLGTEIAAETRAIDTADFVLLEELTSLLAAQGWYVAAIEFDKERDAFVHLADGGELKVTLRQSPLETIDNLSVVLGSDDFTHLEPGEFEYIDLRFGNKVFVNEFGDPVEEIATSTATSTEQ